MPKSLQIFNFDIFATGGMVPGGKTIVGYSWPGRGENVEAARAEVLRRFPHRLRGLEARLIP